jgi:hypothetical protein
MFLSGKALFVYRVNKVKELAFTFAVAFMGLSSLMAMCILFN